MRRLLEILARRLATTTHKVSEPRVPKTLAVIPLGGDVPGIAFIRGLAAALESDGLRVKTVDQADAERPTEWFYTIEAAHDLVLYLAPADSAWRHFCLRQADRVSVVAV